MLLSGWFSKLCERQKKGKLRKSRLNGYRLYTSLVAECLEYRTLLSNVAVTLSAAGALTLTGDSGDHTVAAAVVGGNLELTGSNGTTLTFNGTTAAVVDVPLSGGISSINISMQAGNDSITFNAQGLPKITGNVTASLGDGNDSFIFENATVGGTISVKDGNGADTIQVTADTAAAIAVTAGDGNDSITVTGDTTTKNISVTAGTGTDSITVSNDASAGLLITVGDGADTIVAANDTVTGKLDVHAGNGADTITLTDDTAGGVVVHVGGGTDSISLTRVTLTGKTSSTTASIDTSEGVPGHPLSIVAGNGNDTITLDTVVSGTGAAQGAHWSITLGSGNNVVTINSVTDHGFLSVSATGTGNDSVTISNSTFTKNVVVSLPNGTEQITLSGDTFGNPVFLSTGTGTGSTITVSGSEFDNLVKINMAGPGAIVNVETGTVAGTHTEFHGPVQVTFGASGTVNLGTNAVGDSVIFDMLLKVTGSAANKATVNVSGANVTLNGKLNLNSAVSITV